MKKNVVMPRAVNPVLLPEFYIPDCEARIADGRLYLYGSCDKQDDRYCSKEYYVFSTPDFCRWTAEGPSFTTDAIPAPAEEASARHRQKPEDIMLYAPDVICRDGEYYLYFCTSDGGEGVAVSERPEGPFGEARRLPAKGIDPSVFVDDDGQAYYYWGQIASSAARLSPDMKSIDMESAVHGMVTEAEHHFHEGSSVRKRNGIYYYVFADISRRGRPTCLGYATAKHPLGPYTYQGVIIDNYGCDPESWNNHGCIAEYQGRWYVFYHRSSRKSRVYRRVCCEPIFFDEDGRIPEVKMTSQGPGAAFAPGETIPAYTACGVSGGAYVDGDRLRAVSGGGAVFRYLQGNGAALTLRLSGEGSADVSVLADGCAVGEAKLENGEGSVTIHAPEREWELLLRFENADHCALKSIAIA